MLQYAQQWRFAAPEALPLSAVAEFDALIAQIAISAPDEKAIYEHFKRFLAPIARKPATTSSSLGWARSDCSDLLAAAAENAPRTIEAFYDALEGLSRSRPALPLPPLEHLNGLLAASGAGYRVEPPDLVRLGGFEPVTVAPAVSIDFAARELIEKSLQQSVLLLAEGRHRQAVQEVLWLLETVSTAFSGLPVGEGTVEGDYFNKISRSLKAHVRGTTLEQVLGWISALHGFLSSPKGGGIRHGTAISEGENLSSAQAELYCNLVRSYVAYLLAEYDRIKSEDAGRYSVSALNS